MSQTTIQTFLGTHFYVLHTEIFSKRLLQYNTKEKIHLIRILNIKMWSSFPEQLQHFPLLRQPPRSNLLLTLRWNKSAEKMKSRLSQLRQITFQNIVYLAEEVATNAMLRLCRIAFPYSFRFFFPSSNFKCSLIKNSKDKQCALNCTFIFMFRW